MNKTTQILLSVAVVIVAIGYGISSINKSLAIKVKYENELILTKEKVRTLELSNTITEIQMMDMLDAYYNKPFNHTQPTTKQKI
jgi:hypothetical protein